MRTVSSDIKKPRGILTRNGFSETQITAEIIEGSRSIAADMLKKARKSRCGTIVLGRKGVPSKKNLVMGNVCRKVIEDCRGLAVWIIP
jgi:K+-sensing histidine kinase KdpD